MKRPWRGSRPGSLRYSSTATGSSSTTSTSCGAESRWGVCRVKRAASNTADSALAGPNRLNLVSDTLRTKQVIEIEVGDALLLADVRNLLPLVTVLVDPRFLLAAHHGKSEHLGERDYR